MAPRSDTSRGAELKRFFQSARVFPARPKRKTCLEARRRRCRRLEEYYIRVKSSHTFQEAVVPNLRAEHHCRRTPAATPCHRSRATPQVQVQPCRIGALAVAAHVARRAARVLVPLMAEAPPPKRARFAADQAPVRPADVTPETQSELAAFLAKPAEHTPTRGGRGKGLPPALAEAVAASLARCWAALPPADARGRRVRTHATSPRSRLPESWPMYEVRPRVARPAPRPQARPRARARPAGDARRGLARPLRRGARGPRRRAAHAREEDPDAVAAPGARARGARGARSPRAGAGRAAAADGTRERPPPRARARGRGAAAALVEGCSSSWAPGTLRR